MDHPKMLQTFNKRLKRLCSKLNWPANRRRSAPKIVVKKLGKASSRTHHSDQSTISSAVIHPSSELVTRKPIRVATFNAALFSRAPAVSKTEKNYQDFVMKRLGLDSPKSPKSILKQSPLHPLSTSSPDSGGNMTRQQKFAKSRLRVSINLPDNEISLRRSGQLSFSTDSERVEGSVLKGKGSLRSHSMDFSTPRSGRTVVDVLRELDADVLALQDVKAEEEKNMEPLSELAEALGMYYVFAESWAPEYGNAILSKWPIKNWKAHKIFDDSDFRNVLKATIDVPQAGEVNFFCTHLDHLDENWRMKQMNAIIQSSNEPHILAGGLNSLDEGDYSEERWTDILKYYEEMGKPTPKVEVMKHLKNKQYTDAKDFAGECESVVMIAKGQNVQGTCKYGTRVDYILSSADAPYKFVPGSYSVVSSKGTSDHHIVMADVVKEDNSAQVYTSKKPRTQRSRTVKITHSTSPAKGIWKLNY